MRKPIIAGNWKMNKTPSEAVALVNELLPLVKNDDVDVVFCVPAIDIVPVVEAVKESNVNVGAENLYFDAVEPVIKKYEKESLKKEGRKKNDKNAE